VTRKFKNERIGKNKCFIRKQYIKEKRKDKGGTTIKIFI
jgi:hypothetical protein